MQSIELGMHVYWQNHEQISERASNIMNRITRYLLFNGLSLTTAPRRWPFHDSQKGQSQLSHHPADSTVDMYGEHARVVDREKPNALVTSLGAATAERLASFAAIPMVKERNRNGQYY